MVARGKPKPKIPKPTDAEQHARFVEMARQVEVDESPGALDRAFERVVGKSSSTSKSPK
jgi:hypothetical protein